MQQPSDPTPELIPEPVPELPIEELVPRWQIPITPATAVLPSTPEGPILSPDSGMVESPAMPQAGTQVVIVGRIDYLPESS